MARKTMFLWLLIICIALTGCMVTGAGTNRAIYHGDSGGYASYEAANASDVFWTIFGISLAVAVAASVFDRDDGGDYYDHYYR